MEHMLKTAKIISDFSRKDEVDLNNRDILYIEENDCLEIYSLVTSIRGKSVQKTNQYRIFP